MNDAINLNRIGEDAVTDDVPDEALEIAAGIDQERAMTWGCTNIWWCFPSG